MTEKQLSRVKGASLVEKKILLCVFLPDVLCSFRKSERLGVMEHCFSCDHYERFMREMFEEESKFWNEVDRIRKFGYSGRVT